MSAALIVLAATACTGGAEAPGTGLEGPLVSGALTGKASKEGKVRVVVGLKDKSVEDAVAKLVEGLPGEANQVLPRFKRLPALNLTMDAAGLAKLNDFKDIVSVEEDVMSAPMMASSLKVIGGDRAHRAGFTGKGASVAVIDTGVDAAHPYLGGRVVGEACFSTPDPAAEAKGIEKTLCPGGKPQQVGKGAADPKAPACRSGRKNLCEHGTHVAGTVAGGAVRGAPGPGVAPGAGIVGIQVFTRVTHPSCLLQGGTTSCITTFDSDIMRALEWVQETHKAQKIVSINMSIGTTQAFKKNCDMLSAEGQNAKAMKKVIDQLLKENVATVVAAGNSGHKAAVGHPACISSAVTVGATTDKDGLAEFSNRGELLDVFAPGTQITSSVPGGKYEVFQGTSMAAPHVAGALAVMRQAHPRTPVQELITQLEKSGKAVKYPSGAEQVTTPRIDLEKGVKDASPPPPKKCDWWEILGC